MAAGKIKVATVGAVKLANLAKHLREAKDRDLTKALYKQLYEASFPIQRAATANASRLPKGGGRGAAKYRLKKSGTKTITFTELGHPYQVDYVTRERVRVKSTRAPESLASRVVGAKYSVKGLSGRSPGVRLIARGASGHPIDLRLLDAGIVKHPVFATGPRGTWHWAKTPQAVPARWFSDAVDASSGVVRTACLQAVDEMTAQLRAKG